ncbi:hypothetical protein Tco_0469289 [Tanacetum coccineum]
MLKQSSSREKKGEDSYFQKFSKKDKGKEENRREVGILKSDSDGIPEDEKMARIEADRLLAKKLQEEEREENFKHSEFGNQEFGGIQTLYEKIKRSDEDFISIGSAEDERLIKRMNEKGIDSSKNEMVKEESKEEVKEENKEEESTRKRKLGTRKKMKSRKRRFIQNTSEDDSEKENDELRLHLTIAPDEEKEVDYEILDRKYPIKEWKTECLGTKP